jgi:hypothetical protein
MLERAERASHIDPPASSYAIMQRASPYCGENPGPGKDVRGELEPRPGIREQPGSNSVMPVMSAARPLFPRKRTSIRDLAMSHSCQKRAFAGYATASESLPLISPRQQWHLHQRYDCGLRRLHTLNAFTGRLKPLRASSPANSTSASVSTALNTFISTRICPSLA